ncbi:MAG TPA: cytochrome-c peroxidase, partial [Polyangiaceae bacterium]|nr:cytochrome-c peroxidase [Polyangiaceae bacterium]
MADEPIDRSGFQPSGPVQSAMPAPPAISGGTLMVMRDGVTAVAADPDRDRVYFVDLAAVRLTHTVVLQPGDEPGRMAEDADGGVHVALRRGGAIASLDPRSGAVRARRSVCAAPRGIAYDELQGVLHVACDTGELVTIAPVANAPVRVIQLGRDLRDVVVDGDRLLVSRFRRAEVLVIGADGNLERSIMPPLSPSMSHDGVFEPAVAWRMQPNPRGGALLLHQRGATFAIEVETPDGYGGGESGECTGLVQNVVSAIDADSSVPNLAPALLGGTLVTDMAIAPDGVTAAFAVTGHSWDQLLMPEVLFAANPSDGIDCRGVDNTANVDGEITAVAFDALGRVVVQSREPAFLEIVGGERVVLSTESRADTGLALFHLDPGTGIACA